MAVKTHAPFYKREGRGGSKYLCTNCTLFLMGAMSWCYLCSTLLLYKTKLYDHETNA